MNSLKIFILGTSNSVMTEGYVKALRTIHDVTNLSLGRVSCVYHIKVIIEKRLEIESCDLLILDHYINDINKYIKFFGKSHFNYCKDLYEILSTLNVNIINILFPVLDIRSHVNKYFYKKILEISNFFKIETIDLNDFFHEQSCFKDRLHLKIDLSFGFGVWLGHKLDEIFWEKPKNGLMVKNPYFFIKSINLDSENKNIVKNYINSLININYLEVKEEFCLIANETCSLIAIGYIKEPNECQGLIIDDNRIVLSRYGYLVELLDKTIDCSSVVKVKPLIEYGAYYTLGNREYAMGYFSGAKLVELIFKTDGLNKFISAKRKKINLSLSLDVINNFY